MVERFSEKMRFSAKVQKRSGKTKCKNETAQSAKASLVYYKVIYIISEIIAGVKRNLRKFAFFRGNSSEARWFRVPPPELICVLVINKSHFLLTIIYKVCIIYLYSKGDKSNMENLLLYVLIAIFVFAFLSAVVPLLWADSPILFTFSVIAGVVITWAQGDA